MVLTSDKLEYLDPEGSPLYTDHDLNSWLDLLPQERKSNTNSSFKIPIIEFKNKAVCILVFFKTVFKDITKVKILDDVKEQSYLVFWEGL